MDCIEKIQIKNYRGIKEGEIDKLRNINVFVGRNGSGKSTILEALYLVSHTFNPNSSLKGQSKKIHSMLGKRNIYVSDGQPRSLQLHQDGQKVVHVPDLPKDCWFGNDWDKDIQIIAHKPAIGVKGLKIIIKKEAQKSNVIFLDPMTPFPHTEDEFFSDMVLLDSSLISSKSIEEKIWPIILQNKKKKDLIDSFNKIYSYKIEEIDHTADGFYITPEKTDYGLYLDNLGAGMRIGLRMLFLFHAIKNTIVLMEEFDAYEFPESLWNIARLIMNVSKTNDIQFFMTTHRMESIRAFIENYKDFPDVKCALMCTMLGADGQLKVKNMDFEYAQELIKSGMDIRELEDYE